METSMWRGDGQFWTLHFGVGIAMTILAPALVLTRTYVLDDVPARGTSIAIAVLFLATLPFLLHHARRILDSEHFLRYLYLWDGIGIVGTVIWVALDGGGSSVYAVFFFVLVGHAAMAFPPRATMIAGLAVVFARLVLGLLDVREPIVETVLNVTVLALLAAVAALMSRGQQALVGRARTLTNEARRLADIDGLTGCLNHRAFHSTLVDATALATPAEPLSVLVLDVDHFKAINDSYGHLEGDEVLARLGSLLRGGFRKGDVVGRIGGDEFAVLLPSADRETAAALERRLLDGLAGGLLPHGGKVTVGSATTSGGTEAKVLLGLADAGLYDQRRRDRAHL
ncbi:GGDEF domain-containing protein [Demequina aurantiaca]|uniref:GGDEF domain-containing protein n=1 Tax=Demequina aurantiaca TaxID=676200 RepID=UPI003D33BB44